MHLKKRMPESCHRSLRVEERSLDLAHSMPGRLHLLVEHPAWTPTCTATTRAQPQGVISPPAMRDRAGQVVKRVSLMASLLRQSRIMERPARGRPVERSSSRQGLAKPGLRGAKQMTWISMMTSGAWARSPRATNRPRKPPMPMPPRSCHQWHIPVPKVCRRGRGALCWAAAVRRRGHPAFRTMGTGTGMGRSTRAR